jgi:large exoprotein involved in heme utilization and adhesion
LADGGNITLRIDRFMRLADSKISTSVKNGAGNGGNISIDPQFLSLLRSTIAANAVQGRGGNVTIVADQFVPSAESAVTASSSLGVSDSIEVVGPRTDLNGSLVTCRASFVRPPRWRAIPALCDAGCRAPV